MNQTANQIKEGEIKTTNFTIDQWNHARKINAIEIYSTHNEGKSVVAERFIRTLKNKIDKYMALDGMKPVDIKPEVNNEDPKLKIGDIVRIS